MSTTFMNVFDKTYASLTPELYAVTTENRENKCCGLCFCIVKDLVFDYMIYLFVLDFYNLLNGQKDGWQLKKNVVQFYRVQVNISFLHL